MPEYRSTAPEALRMAKGLEALRNKEALQTKKTVDSERGRPVIDNTLDAEDVFGSFTDDKIMESVEVSKPETLEDPFVDEGPPKALVQPSKPPKPKSKEKPKPKRLDRISTDETFEISEPGLGPNPTASVSDTSDQPDIVPTRESTPAPLVIPVTTGRPYSAVRVKEEALRNGDRITVVDFKYDEINVDRFVELSMVSKAKLSREEVTELSQYEALDYQEKSAVWSLMAERLIGEVNAIPKLNYDSVYGEIQRASITLKQEPTFQDCWRTIGEAYGHIQRLDMIRTRLMPIVATLDNAYSTLVDTWVSISLATSDSTRQGEAKMRLHELIQERNKARALLETLTLKISTLKIGWDTASRQQTALSDSANLGGAGRYPVDIEDEEPTQPFEMPEFEGL